MPPAYLFCFSDDVLILLAQARNFAILECSEVAMLAHLHRAVHHLNSLFCIPEDIIPPYAPPGETSELSSRCRMVDIIADGGITKVLATAINRVRLLSNRRVGIKDVVDAMIVTDSGVFEPRAQVHEPRTPQALSGSDMEALGEDDWSKIEEGLYGPQGGRRPWLIVFMEAVSGKRKRSGIVLRPY
ncbi:MAG: hypothetical protein JWM11_1983 [Planctomycetaceae bacterium]|nr:hypothetical protein [Planctomycetaceae bacterium]